MRFAVNGNVNSPDGMVALSMLRLLTRYMLDNNMIRPIDLKKMQEAALAELPTMNNASFNEARRLVEGQFP